MRILYTGDLARLREDGLVEFVGRKDRVIKIRGKRVDLLEIEEVLRNCDNITDAAVAWRGDDKNSALVAYVVGNALDTQLVAQQINLAIAARLPGYMRPTQFRIVDVIPRLPSLKPDIQALAKLDTVSLAVFECGPACGTEMSKDRMASRRVRAAVKKAWTEVLGRKSFAANLRWDQAGGNSLNALRLWFFIEEFLNKRLPLDALNSSATPSDLIAAIEKLLDSAPFPVVSSQDARPLVFFMPAFDGDAPNLVRLRAEFQGKLRFAVAHYPSWREMCSAGARFDLIIDAVMAQVIATFGKNDCLLAGYSFGGFVAWDIARRLMESGRRVPFVGLIDTRRKDLTNPPGSRSIRILRSMYANRQVAKGVLPKLVIRPLIYVSAFPILQAIGNLAMLLPARAAFQFHSALIAELRLHALRQSETKPLQMPVTLFRSDEQLSTSPDFGWGALCAKLDVVPIGGSHGSILEPPRRALLYKSFLAAVERASQKSDVQATAS